MENSHATGLHCFSESLGAAICSMQDELHGAQLAKKALWALAELAETPGGFVGGQQLQHRAVLPYPKQLGPHAGYVQRCLYKSCSMLLVCTLVFPTHPAPLKEQAEV